MMSPAPGRRRGPIGKRQLMGSRWFNARRRQRGGSIERGRRHNAGQAWGRRVRFGDGEDLGRVEAAPVVGQSDGGVDGLRLVLVRHQGDHALQHDDANQHRQHTSGMGPESGHPFNNDPYRWLNPAPRASPKGWVGDILLPCRISRPMPVLLGRHSCSCQSPWSPPGRGLRCTTVPSPGSEQQWRSWVWWLSTWL